MAFFANTREIVIFGFGKPTVYSFHLGECASVGLRAAFDHLLSHSRTRWADRGSWKKLGVAGSSPRGQTHVGGVLLGSALFVFGGLKSEQQASDELTILTNEQRLQSIEAGETSGVARTLSSVLAPPPSAPEVWAACSLSLSSSSSKICSLVWPRSASLVQLNVQFSFRDKLRRDVISSGLTLPELQRHFQGLCQLAEPPEVSYREGTDQIHIGSEVRPFIVRCVPHWCCN